jgi:hypothetical protein
MSSSRAWALIPAFAAAIAIHGCAVIQPGVSVGAGYVTHERISTLEEEVDRDKIDSLERRISSLERRLSRNVGGRACGI